MAAAVGVPAAPAGAPFAFQVLLLSTVTTGSLEPKRSWLKGMVAEYRIVGLMAKAGSRPAVTPPGTALIEFQVVPPSVETSGSRAPALAYSQMRYRSTLPE